jgi:pimeloyl-ACP methyl ester carboxylesterase
MHYDEPIVQLEDHRLYVRDYPGIEPPIILMHGFPDNLHLYDRLVPHLTPTRRVVTFDFLGWGASDKPTAYRHTAANQSVQLDAVIEQLRLEDVVLVAHDASGPPAIDWALAHPERIVGLVLLNTYYQWHPGLRRPQAIALYSTPIVRNAARWMARRFENLDRALYFWQVGRFIRDPDVRKALVPELYAQFREARPAFWALNDDLLGTVLSRRKNQARMRAFDRSVRIVFGDADPYLNKRVARRLHELFRDSELFLLPGARHYVQVDEPEQVARLVLSMPLAAPG